MSVRVRASLAAAALGLGGLSAPATAAAADFVVIRNEVTVERSADQVWRRIGGYCAIAEWLQVGCELVSGTGQAGSVRRLNGTTIEPMVAQTARSYTYWQSQGNMAPTAFHGTLAAEPDGPARTRLSYTLVYDQSALASDAMRSSEHDRLDGRFRQALTVMKALSEK